MQHVDAVFAFCASRVGREAAEDLTADVFCRALAAWGRYEDRGLSPRPWLMQIAYNRIVEHWRRGGRSEPMDQPRDGVSPDADPGSVVAAADEIERVMPALGQLPELQRAVLTMRFLGEMSVAETAAALDSTEEAVRAATMRGIRALRGRFADASDR